MKHLPVVFALVMLALAQAEARVSLRIGGNAPVVLEAAGGAVVHAGDYRVNGIEARVEVLAFKDAQPGLAASLLRRFGLEPGAAADAAMVRLPAKYGRAWLLTLPGQTGCRLGGDPVTQLRAKPNPRNACEMELSVFSAALQTPPNERLAWGAYTRQGCAPAAR